MNLLLSSEHLKAEALRLGFFAVGLSPAEPLSAERVAQREAWLQEGFHGEMSYMERNEDKRRDPRLLVEGVRTIVSVAMNYNTLTPEAAATDHIPIARYARGRDYHDVMKARLNEWLVALADTYGAASLEGARAFVDTAPVDERYWAWQESPTHHPRCRKLFLPGRTLSAASGRPLRHACAQSVWQLHTLLDGLSCSGAL